MIQEAGVFLGSSSVAVLRIEECYLRNHKWGYEDSDTVGQLSTRCLKGQVLYFATQISTSSREGQHLWLGAIYNLICLSIMINLVTCHPILFLKDLNQDMYSRVAQETINSQIVM